MYSQGINDYFAMIKPSPTLHFTARMPPCSSLIFRAAATPRVVPFRQVAKSGLGLIDNTLPSPQRRLSSCSARSWWQDGAQCPISEALCHRFIPSNNARSLVSWLDSGISVEWMVLEQSLQIRIREHGNVGEEDGQEP